MESINGKKRQDAAGIAGYTKRGKMKTKSKNTFSWQVFILLCLVVLVSPLWAYAFVDLFVFLTKLALTFMVLFLIIICPVMYLLRTQERKKPNGKS